MKALILCGGRGTRLRPLTATIPKHLLPVANRPVLFYVLDKVVEADVTDVGVVVSNESAEQIRGAAGDGSGWGIRITYILQPEPLGLAHAVQTAGEFLGDSSFLVFLGDNLIEGGIRPLVEQFSHDAPDALILLKEVAEPHAFGVAEPGEGGRIVSVVEKPERPRTNLAIVGVYLFSPKVHEAIARIRPSRRGELEITDAIQQLIDMGGLVRGHILDGWWLDTGDKEGLLRANRVVLDHCLRWDIKGEVDSQSRVVGRVEIGEGARLENSLVRGPVSIAAGCRIRNSTVGPFSSIGQGTVIENSLIENSVILDGCHIADVERLVDGLIGKGGI